MTTTYSERRAIEKVSANVAELAAAAGPMLRLAVDTMKSNAKSGGMESGGHADAMAASRIQDFIDGRDLHQDTRLEMIIALAQVRRALKMRD